MERLGRLHRHAERGLTEREHLNALLDSELVGTLATVVEGAPWAVPMLYARDGDRVLLHGSTGAGALRHVAAGAPVAVCVTALDDLVVAATTFSSSANYRSAVIRGVPRPLEGDERERALELLSERILPGRPAEVRPMSRKEVQATLAMELPITDGAWIMKARTGLPATNADAEADADVWAGVVPVVRAYGEPQPAPWASDLPVPASVAELTGRAERSAVPTDSAR